MPANLRYIVNSVGWKALIESAGTEEMANLAEALAESAKAEEVEGL